MWFVNPAFLWAFGLLAIPVLIHLFHFRRYKRVYFPSLKTLKELNREKKSIKSLKKWVILVLRLLAFASLVLAFAQPFFLKDQQKSVSGISVVSIYIDNSFSMSAKGMEGSLFNESKELARKLIEKNKKKIEEPISGPGWTAYGEDSGNYDLEDFFEDFFEDEVFSFGASTLMML